MKKRSFSSLELLAALYDVRHRLVRGWTQGLWAIDKEGNSINPMDDEAFAWSLAGAIHAIPSSELEHAVADLFMATLPRGHSLTTYNDEVCTSVRDVLQVVDRLIENPTPRRMFPWISRYHVQDRAWWVFHNLVAHPLMVLCPPLGNYLHTYSAERMEPEDPSLGDDDDE